jgi:hypothetical protein
VTGGERGERETRDEKTIGKGSGAEVAMTLEEALVEVWRQALAEGAEERGKLETRSQKLESGGKYAEWRVVGGEWREEEKAKA